MLLARGISGLRKTAKARSINATGSRPSRVGSQTATSADAQVLMRKIASPWRVISEYAVHRNGAMAATPG